MGHPAERIFYSGAGLRKPYDVEITWDEATKDILAIEAKRTWKDRITIQSKWLDLVNGRHVIVFAMGDHRKGRAKSKLYVVEELQGWGIPTSTVCEKVKVGKRYKTISMVPNQVLRLPNRAISLAVAVPVFQVKSCVSLFQDLLGAFSVLEYKQRAFLVRDFDEYMNDTWSSKLKKKEVLDGTQT